MLYAPTREASPSNYNFISLTRRGAFQRRRRRGTGGNLSEPAALLLQGTIKCCSLVLPAGPDTSAGD